MPLEGGKPPEGLGARAYENELTRLLGDFVVVNGMSPAVDLAEAISRVGQAAAQDDFLGAIRLLGEVEIAIAPSRPAANRGSVQPEDVEQALGDLRRALDRWGTEEGRAAATALCREARKAAGEGRWNAAWALIEEADERLALRAP